MYKNRLIVKLVSFVVCFIGGSIYYTVKDSAEQEPADAEVDRSEEHFAQDRPSTPAIRPVEPMPHNPYATPSIERRATSPTNATHSTHSTASNEQASRTPVSTASNQTAVITPQGPTSLFLPGAIEQETADPQQLQQQSSGPTTLIIDPRLTGGTTDTNHNTQTDNHHEQQPQPQPLALTHSPEPTARTLGSYSLWTVNESYNMLGQSYELADWSFQPSVEFEQTGANALTAEWDARGGVRGIGLDVQLHTLYPRDVGMASPVVEDNASRQIFRLGRREIRARGDAHISYKDINGLLVWRIMVPAEGRSQLATCYYTAIVGDQAAVFTARYDKDRPQQMDGFDAMLGTLQYNGTP